MQFLRTSARAFYAGDFAESVRIATILRTLVHETGRCKPLLKQARPNALDLPILEHAAQSADDDALFRFAVSVRLGSPIAPAVDLHSSHNTSSSIGAWWGREVFAFRSWVGTQLIYTRKRVMLILADKEGGAHVDPFQDPDYVRLLTDSPLSFADHGLPVATPDLARFLAAQSGVQMLDSLKRNFFPEEDVPRKWEFGEAPAIAHYMDQISLAPGIVSIPFPNRDIRITARR